MSPLRGHAYFLERVGSSGPGWGPWVVAVAVGALVLLEVGRSVIGP